MLIMFDTSVLVAGFVASHPKHLQAISWIKRARDQEFSWAVAAHGLAECYAVLTRLPLTPKIPPSTAKLLLEENIEKSATLVELSVSEYSSLIKETANLGLSGGIIYDAIIVKSAQKIHAQKILTFNLRDFHRLLPGKSEFVISP